MAITFRETTLPNGLTIIGETDPTAHTAAMGFFVKTGARDEAPEVMGVSHFLEHMMFKGTDSRTAEDVDREFDDLGADHNAFTSAEMTCFYAHALPEHLGKAEDVLSDILRPALRDDDFDDEKPVILEEIAMYDDQPFWVLYERAMEGYFGAHPLAHRVLGTNETIEKLSVEQMRTYFDDRYSADNTVVAMAGNIEWDAMVDRIADHCGAWVNTGAAREDRSLGDAEGDVRMTSDAVNRHYGLMIAPAPSIQDDDRHPAGMLAYILGGGDGSRLHWSLIETGLAEEAQAEFSGRDGLGNYLAFWVCSPDDGERVGDAMRTAIAELTPSLTDDDLVRAKSKIATAATFQGELPSGRMQRLGRVWTYTGMYRSLEDELARIEAVTLDDLRSVSERWPIEPRTIATMTPES